MGLGQSRLQRILTRAGLLVAMFAVTLRVLVPGGYMVSQAGGREDFATLVICTGQGAMTVAVDADGKIVDTKDLPGKGGGKAASDHSCIFAGFASPLQTPSLLSLAAPTHVITSAVAAPVSYQRPGLGLAAPPPPQTGPPSIV